MSRTILFPGVAWRRLFASCRIISSWIAIAFLCQSTAAQQFEGWHLEPGVGQAHLIMVARVESISRMTVVQGAKTDVVLREYRFQPVKRLKGIFQRDQLSMTASDLGSGPESSFSAPLLKEGEFRLLILAQQQGRFLGCVSAAPGAATFDERVPRLSGPDDPLVSVVETLIRVADSRSRRQRARLLVDQLSKTEGLATVPLLTSLRARADWAATDDRAYTILARLVADSSMPVRGGALMVLREMLASRSKPKDQQQLDAVASSLRKSIESDEPITSLRVSALEALGHLLAMKSDLDWPRELLISQSKSAATHAERQAAFVALARITDAQAVAAVLEVLTVLPLDESPNRETLFARAAIRMDRTGAERILLERLKQSLAARQSLDAEIVALARIRSKESVPLLLAAFRQSIGASDRNRIAWALGELKDEQAVPMLAYWLRWGDQQIKSAALTALEKIDSPSAAQEVRPLLKPEAHLPFKLRIARLLARHDIDDGYALASEHLADVEHTPSATLVLAALQDPRTTTDLSGILAARPDRRWHGAALSGLAAIGDADAQKQLLDILADERNPLVADAAEAAGLAGDVRMLVPLANLVQSRNKQIAMAALLALRRFLSDVRTSPEGLAAAANLPASSVEEWLPVLSDLQADPPDGQPRDAEAASDPASPRLADIPAEARMAITQSVASLVLDTYVDADLRRQAFDIARRMKGDGYSKLLTELADQAELEGTRLFTDIQMEQRRWR